VKFQPHKVNFKHCGCYYELDDGRGVYLAHRRYSAVYRKRNAWCVERIALEEARSRGYLAAGVAVRDGKKTYYFLTNIEDWFGEHSFVNPDNILQRGLPLNRFLITPSSSRENVDAAMRLR